MNLRHPAPKAGALPTALHPVIEFFIRLVVFTQTRRDTNFAIPGYSLFCHDTTASGKNKDFSVCGHSCGQSRFCAVFGNRRKSCYRPCCKALRRFALPCPGYRHGTPKPGAMPTSPDIHFSCSAAETRQGPPGHMSADQNRNSIVHLGKDCKNSFSVVT